jgi:adenosine deaminase
VGLNLHTHLEGWVRPDTAADLARAMGVPEPAGGWDDALRMREPADLTVFLAHVAAAYPVLGSAESLRRVAREAVEDVAADGVVYLETRFGPLSHQRSGLGTDEVMAAVIAGLAEGEAATGTVARLIVCGIREDGPALGLEAARLAVAWGDRGVVGYDIAGAEVGHPAADFAEAYAVAGEAGLGRTVHAGEMDGIDSLASALTVDPDRIGHGWRLSDDLDGPVAREVRDRGLPLEVCVTSNACLGLPVDEHPVRRLVDAGFDVTVNPDDRAITTTTTSRELALWAEHHGFSDTELAAVQQRAVTAAFCDDTTRAEVAATITAGWP